MIPDEQTLNIITNDFFSLSNSPSICNVKSSTATITPKSTKRGLLNKIYHENYNEIDKEVEKVNKKVEK